MMVLMVVMMELGTLWDNNLRKRSWGHGKWWLYTQLQKEAHTEKAESTFIPGNRFLATPGTCLVSPRVDMGDH